MDADYLASIYKQTWQKKKNAVWERNIAHKGIGVSDSEYANQSSE